MLQGRGSNRGGGGGGGGGGRRIGREGEIKARTHSWTLPPPRSVSLTREKLVVGRLLECH